MIYAVIGHRGVGKTRFLKRIQVYYQSLQQKVFIFDLDHEIELRSQTKIETLFKTHGEAYFRVLEEKTFLELLKEAQLLASHGSVFIALGAGYKGSLPSSVKVLWLARPTDSQGRIFLNRPRLNSNVPPLEEYLERYSQRSADYAQKAHRILMISEGFTEANEIEPYMLGLKPYDLQWGITVLPWIFESDMRFYDFISHMTLLGVRFFELRDDWLSLSQINQFISQVDVKKIVYSCRKKDFDHSKVKEWGHLSYDWALELGPCPYLKPDWLSLHDRLEKESVEEAAARLTSHPANHYKFAIKINNFLELWSGHQWAMQDPQNRSFLPMTPMASREPRWTWYRLLYGHGMKVNFFREGASGSATDQPTLFDVLRVKIQRGLNKSSSFAALLGYPVTHSQTPAIHFDFFKQKGLPVVTVALPLEEANALTLGILDRLGLVAAAVTAPLKEKFAEVVNTTDHKAINTLVKKSLKSWMSTNTDIEGFHELVKYVPAQSLTAAWGGGGTRVAIEASLPDVKIFSARTGEATLVDAKNRGVEVLPAQNFNPQCVIWCVGRSRMSDCQWPPASWKPQIVIDLNYTEDSPGLEYALQVGAQYISGLEMFKAQARAQKVFWSQHLQSV